MLYTGIFAIPTLICSLPRTFDGLSWLSIGSVCSIAIAGIVGMVGAGLHPEPGREFDIVQTTTFYNAFISVTNPVFAYAGHFMQVPTRSRPLRRRADNTVFKTGSSSSSPKCAAPKTP
jgi:hypothetical protein